VQAPGPASVILHHFASNRAPESALDGELLGV
jgi:hypothetical protein